MSIDSIAVVHAIHHETGDYRVLIKCFEDEDLIFFTAMRPESARAIAADLLKHSAECEAAVATARAVAAAAIGSAKER